MQGVKRANPWLRLQPLLCPRALSLALGTGLIVALTQCVVVVVALPFQGAVPNGPLFVPGWEVSCLPSFLGPSRPYH